MRLRLTLVLCAALVLTVGVTAAIGASSENANPAGASSTAKGPDPVRSTVTVDRASAAADGAVTVRVTITALDGKGHPVPRWNASVWVSGDGNTVVQPGETDKHGVAVAQLRSTISGTKIIQATLSRQGATVVLAQVPQVEFVALRSLEVQVYQSRLGTGDNCFLLDREQNLPASGGTFPISPPVSGAWASSGVQPRGGFTTWVRAVAQSSDAPNDWQDVSGAVSWSVLDPGATGTTIDPASGRVTTGAGSGTVHVVASLAGIGLASPTNEGTLTIANAALANIRINPADDEDPNSPSFGADPIYVPAGASAPMGVAGTFTGADAGNYCITWDTSMSSDHSEFAVVGQDGIVTGVSPGAATVSAGKGATIRDTIPVNVGPAEVQSLRVSPTSVTMPAAATVQLSAVARYTDGSSTVVTTDPATTWFVDPIDDVLVLQVSDGLVSNAGFGVAGDSDEIGACFQSGFIRPDGVPITAATCSSPNSVVTLG